jgi:hypothetical protein
MAEPVVITIFHPPHCSHCVTNGNFLVYGTVTPEEVAMAKDGLVAYAQVAGERPIEGLRVLLTDEPYPPDGARFDWAFLFRGVPITSAIRIVVQSRTDPSTRAITHFWSTAEEPTTYDPTITICYPPPPTRFPTHVTATFTAYGVVDAKPADFGQATVTATLNPGAIAGQWNSNPPTNFDWAFDCTDVTPGTYTLTVQYHSGQVTSTATVTIVIP